MIVPLHNPSESTDSFGTPSHGPREKGACHRYFPVSRKRGVEADHHTVKTSQSLTPPPDNPLTLHVGKRSLGEGKALGEPAPQTS